MDQEFGEDNSNSRVLIVGDGDFSFSVAFAKRYSLPPFTTSTIEDHTSMKIKYPDYEGNSDFLHSKDIIVLPSVDATKLESVQGLNNEYTHIIFNFPHVGGKSNLKRNRLLLKHFFQSAVSRLSKRGKVMVTLCKGQGGTGADNPKREWCNSWKITEQAAYSDLILTKVALFEGPTLFDDYTSVGFRSQNKRFGTDNSLVHTFTRSCPLFEPVDAATPNPKRLDDISTGLWELVNILTEAWNVNYTSTSRCSAAHSSHYKQWLQLQIGLSPPRGTLLPITITVRDWTNRIGLCQSEVTLYNGIRTLVIGQITPNNEILINLSVMASLLFRFSDVRAFFAKSFTCQTQKLSPYHYQLTQLNTFNLYPPIYTHFITFWIGKGFELEQFFRYMQHACRDLLVDVELSDEYLLDGRISHCYRLEFSSSVQALTYEQSYRYYQVARNNLHTVDSGLEVR